MNKKFVVSILVTLFGVTSIFSNEVSVFDAGNLDKENPYGLTNNEKIILKNRQNIGSVKSDIANAQESIDGMRSVIDGINANNQKIDMKITDLQEKISVRDLNTTNEISKLKDEINSIKATQKAQYKKITEAITALSALIDANAKNKTSAAKSENFEGKKSADVLSLADKAYKNKQYSTAKSAYEHLIKKNYKPAYSNFMLGEIEYEGQSYEAAIPYYQKSVEIYAKSSYMPKLLYHTAISFDKIGDTDNANKFYHALKQAYPETAEAKSSPNRE